MGAHAVQTVPKLDTAMIYIYNIYIYIYILHYYILYYMLYISYMYHIYHIYIYIYIYIYIKVATRKHPCRGLFFKKEVAGWSPTCNCIKKRLWNRYILPRKFCTSFSKNTYCRKFSKTFHAKGCFCCFSQVSHFFMQIVTRQ